MSERAYASTSAEAASTSESCAISPDGVHVAQRDADHPARDTRARGEDVVGVAVGALTRLDRDRDPCCRPPRRAGRRRRAG